MKNQFVNYEELIKSLSRRYAVQPEHLWKQFPQYAVFRHSSSGKWFAILMNIAAEKLGLPVADIIWILNVKARPEMVGVLRMMKGIYPAYHMNKEHWVSIHLAEIDETLLWELVKESFDLTEK